MNSRFFPTHFASKYNCKEPKNPLLLTPEDVSVILVNIALCLKEGDSLLFCIHIYTYVYYFSKYAIIAEMLGMN